MNEERAVHTEHRIWRCYVSPDNTDGTRLFRAPTVLDGSGTQKRLPHEIAWEDVHDGDILLAILISDDSDPPLIDVLQFWHVLTVDKDGGCLVEVNNIAGSAADGEYIFDRFAGFLGLPPGTQGERRE